MSGYSPGLSGIQGPLRAIQGPPPHEDRPDVEKKKINANILMTLIFTWIILTESVCIRP